MTDITDFPIKAFGKETPDRLLKVFNNEGSIKDIVIFGIDEEGSISVSSSFESHLELLGLIEVVKQEIIEDKYDI